MRQRLLMVKMNRVRLLVVEACVCAGGCHVNSCSVIFLSSIYTVSSTFRWLIRWRSLVSNQSRLKFVIKYATWAHTQRVLHFIKPTLL